MVEQSEKISPAPTDILSARGRGYANLEGNKVFTRLVKKHANAYNDPRARRQEKARIIESIREQLSKDNMRFLQKNKHGSWVEMKARDIRLKVSHALRDSRGEQSVSTKAQQCIASLSTFDTTAREHISFVLAQEVTPSGHTTLPLKCASSSDQQLYDQMTSFDNDCLGVEPDSLISLQGLAVVAEPVDSCSPSLPVETIEDVFASIILKEQALDDD